MAKTKESYQVPSLSPEVNFVLARIADRLDKIEGLRGDPQIEEKLEIVETALVDDDNGNGTRIKGELRHETAPSSTLAEGEWEITVYDDGSSPVFRVRYNDGENILVGDVALT